MKRILHLRTISGKGGGPEKTLLTTPKFLQGEYDVRLAYIRPQHDPEFDMPERARLMGVSLVDIPERGALDVRTLWSLRREIATFQPHLLHPHDYKANVLAVLLGHWFRLPTISMMHGYVTISSRLNLYYRIDRWALRRMNHVIAVSEDLYELAGAMGIPAERRSLVENAIDTERFSRSMPPIDAKKRLNLPTHGVVIGAVGRLQPEKGFDLLMRAVANLIELGHDITLVIIGDGPLRGDLQNLAERLGYPTRLRLLGHQANPLDYYLAMDLFVLSSLREGLPNVVLEAMSMEVPVVATRVAGVPRVVQDGKSGLLVDTGNLEQLQTAIEALVSDVGKRRLLAESARSVMEERYSFPQRIQKIRAIYSRVLGA